jgi:hypothetical protein
MTTPCTLDNGFECCCYCWEVFGGEGRGVNPGIGGGINYTYGPVVHAETAREYEYIGASPAGTPLAHPDCYKEWAETTNDTDATLSEFTQ